MSQKNENFGETIGKSREIVNLGVTIGNPWVFPCFLHFPNESEMCEKSGIGIEILRFICDSNHFNCNFVVKNHTTFGKKSPNGTWIGVLGDIDEGKIDTGLPYFDFTPERFEHFIFSPAFLMRSRVFIIRRSTVKSRISARGTCSGFVSSRGTYLGLISARGTCWGHSICKIIKKSFERTIFEDFIGLLKIF